MRMFLKIFRQNLSSYWEYILIQNWFSIPILTSVSKETKFSNLLSKKFKVCGSAGCSPDGLSQLVSLSLFLCYTRMGTQCTSKLNFRDTEKGCESYRGFTLQG